MIDYWKDATGFDDNLPGPYTTDGRDGSGCTRRLGPTDELDNGYVTNILPDEMKLKVFNRNGRTVTVPDVTNTATFRDPVLGNKVPILGKIFLSRVSSIAQLLRFTLPSHLLVILFFTRHSLMGSDPCQSRLRNQHLLAKSRESRLRNSEPYTDTRPQRCLVTPIPTTTNVPKNDSSAASQS